jgi:hypothetical protein
MIENLTLTLATILLLVSGGLWAGGRLLPGSAPETRIGVGACLATAWLGMTAAAGILLRAPFRAVAIVGIASLVAAAIAGARSFRTIIAVPAVWVTTVLALFGSAMMATPFVPEGQVQGGVVFETRIPNRPADNRLPYRTGQFILHGIDPDQEEYFLDWKVTDRTQLTAAASATIVSAVGIDVARETLWYLPDGTSFTPVDRFGYWGFRATGIVFNALLPLTAAALAAALLGRRHASVAAIAASVSVFALVETMYTWPKFAGVAAATAGGAALLSGGPVLAGVLFGAAYLSHPMCILLAPGMLVLGWVQRRSWRALAVAVAATGVTVAPWWIWTTFFEHTTSSMTLYPLGWGIRKNRTLAQELPVALRHFWDRFPGGVLHDRWVSARDSLAIRDIVPILARRVPPSNVFGFYDRTVPGIVGLALVPSLIAGFVHSARARLGLGVSALATSIAILGMWGIAPRALGADTLQPLVPLMAVAVAIGACGTPLVRLLFPVIAYETWLVVDDVLLTGLDDWRRPTISALYLATLVLGTTFALWTARRAWVTGDRPVDYGTPEMASGESGDARNVLPCALDQDLPPYLQLRHEAAGRRRFFRRPSSIRRGTCLRSA